MRLFMFFFIAFYCCHFVYADHYPAVCKETGKGKAPDLRDPYRAGLFYMGKHDFVSAIGYLETAVKGKYKNSSIVHYYLANCLWQRGRYDDALIAYAKSYVLDPTGQSAKHSLRVLKHYSQKVESIASKRVLTPRAKQVVAAVGLDPEKVGMKKKQVVGADPKQLVEVKKKMPRLNKVVWEKPTTEQFNNWTLGAKADYLPTVESRLVAAKEHLNKSLADFRQAKVYAEQIIPRHKQHAESNTDARQRYERAKKDYNTLMQPYRDEISSATRYVNDLIDMRNQAWLAWGQERNVPYISIPKEASGE